ncbi:asparagine synthase (glutamine-hydrolyzing) [Terricaulis silvestris]|uniref:asparagine synthase (glutamine-hydrolyzing) n=1 Tax=Terricaulis silvestris TaxID=2686094 RepID=A0A6I6MFS7_9CAUL|nr:asparagine synthase (glutamine-hydrolyzing) [Terricaulis silvestris]QGZ93385.1 Asparagine synthetase [glutamine-hydrolyzing] 3 [Terricaulis silvestris]
MSGIAGIIRFDGGPAEPALVEQMTSAMAHRGPDGVHHWFNGSVGLGQCMLRTTPESLAESQPLANEDESVVLVMDGRVDNCQELRQDLLSRGLRLRDVSDAELVLRAYEFWGEGCLSRIEGDFALVIWNAKKQRAFCARDRLGNKPFYYHRAVGGFYFASECHALLALPGVPDRLNEGMVAEFLTGRWCSMDETFWLDVAKLQASYAIVVDQLGLRLDKYWSPDLQACLAYKDERQYVEHYRQLLTTIVRRMCRSAAPVACEVSGGLDSSAIYAVAERLRQDGKLPAPALDGYTLDFAHDAAANELTYARSVASHLGREVREIPPSRMEFSWFQERATRYREFPSYPNGAMGLGIREAARTRGSRVLLVGVGGDEWLGGSRSYYAEALAEGSLRNLCTALVADTRHAGFHVSLWWLLRHGLYPLLPSAARDCLRDMIDPVDRRREAWLAPRMTKLLAERRALVGIAPDAKARRVGQREMALTLSGAFSKHALELEERMASEVGIELRRPFFDANLIEFCFALPRRLQLQGGSDKYLHRRAMADLLPQQVVERQGKAEFSVMFRSYRADVSREMRQMRTEETRSWLSEKAMAGALGKYGDDRNSSWTDWQVWALLACEAVSRSGKHT